MNQIEQLLEQMATQNFAVIRLLARLNLSSEKVESILTKKRSKSNAVKFISAYNLCDGKTPASQIAERFGIDQGNFCRDLQHWEGCGILIKMSSAKEVFPFALFPIIANNRKGAKDDGQN